MTKKGIMILDLQYGSTGKGLLAGYLAKREKPDTVVTAWSANAGHTFIDNDGRKFVHTMLANGVVSPNLRRIMIGPGAMMNPKSLHDEIRQCIDLLAPDKRTMSVRIMIHENAGVITDEHRATEEATMTSIGSTKKGCGAALAQKIRRDPDNVNVASMVLKGTSLENLVVSIAEYNDAIDSAEVLMIEGAQGFSLSIHHGFYPYCTSKDVTPAQICADTGVPIGRITDIIGCMRTFPIRVANRYDDKGEQIGWSGPCYDDQKEMTWAEVGVPPETTTVTKLERRVFSFSEKQIAEAFRACEPTAVFINFMNYLPVGEWGDFIGKVNRIGEQVLDRPGIVKLTGYGPAEKDVVKPEKILGHQ